VEIIRSVDQMRRRSAEFRDAGSVVALVPTMGALHEGHLSLVRLAGELADVVVVSVFVNPTQFGPSEDFERYPRDLDEDARLAADAGADVVFAPEAREVYPAGFETVVHVQKLTRKMCGAFRPGHFEGVTTVVAKLLNVVRPNVAVFGQKDGQQAAVIERMAADLDMGVEIVRGPTVREPDGLAMSSRNAYLSPEERKDALVLHEALEYAEQLYRCGESDAALLLDGMRTLIGSVKGAEIQYVAAVDAKTLEDVPELGPGVMFALAVVIGKTRLIDNVVLGERKRGEEAGGSHDDG
jgi:pantoate--beta-alanine ligase